MRWLRYKELVSSIDYGPPPESIENKKKADPWYRVRDFMDFSNECFIEPVKEVTVVSMDEKQAPAQMAGPVKTYKPDKPHKWGIYYWCMNDCISA